MNLTGTKIKNTYKSLLTFPDATGLATNPTTLRQISDGGGVSTPLQLSTTRAQIGATGVDGLLQFGRASDGAAILAMGVRPSTSDFYMESNNFNFRTNSTGFFFGGGSTWVTPTARMQVRGDGTNNIARFETSAGSSVVSVNETSLAFGNLYSPSISSALSSSGSTSLSGQSLLFRTIASSGFGYIFSWNSAYSSEGSFFNILAPQQQLISGTNTNNILNITYIVNTIGGTNTVNGIYLNATEISTTSTTHYLMDLQVGGASMFKVDNSGNGIFSASIFTSSYMRWIGGSVMRGLTDGVILMSNSSVTDFSRLQFGGTTNLFGAIKRNGTEFQFKLADDSTFTRIECSQLKVNNGLFMISNVALTNGAGASAGTITNAPAVGNPTKWIPIDDAGVTRYIPCW